MSKRTAKQTKVYRNAALAILRKAGAQADESGNSYMYTVGSNLGLLRVSVWDSCVMCRFEDVARAKAQFGDSPHDRFNPHSGKWNWMGGMSHEGDMSDLEDFERAIEPLLPESRTANPTLPLVPYAA